MRETKGAEKLRQLIKDELLELLPETRYAEQLGGERKGKDKPSCFASKRFLLQIFERARDVMVYRMSLPDGCYEYVSPAVEHLLGYLPEEFYDCPWFIKNCIHPHWKAYLEVQTGKLLVGEMPPVYEYQVIHKSGAFKWMRQENVLVREENGRPSAIEGIVRDVTREKEAEEALEKTCRRLRNESEQLVRKDVELLCKENELEAVNKELVEAKRALSELVKKIDRDKEELESRIARIIVSTAIPIVEKLQKEKSSHRCGADLNTLFACLNEFIPSLVDIHEKGGCLSETELLITTFIKKGLTSSEIAEHMSVSLDTIKTHRKNIRKKLDLKNSNLNLASYLNGKPAK